MRDYTKMFNDTNIDVSNFIIGYDIQEEGIYIQYADNGERFEAAEDETEQREIINIIEEGMKLQVTVLFNTLYDKDYPKLLQEIKEDKKLVNKKLTSPLIILVLSIILTFNLLYIKSFPILLLIIVGNLIGRNKAIKVKKLNEKSNAKGELAKRINFLKIEDELNEALIKDFDLIVKGTKKKTKLIIKDNLESNLPAITMNDISEISLKDLNKMLSNMIDSDKQYNIKDLPNNNLDKTKANEINITNKKENNNSYKFDYKYDLNYNNKNTYDEDLSKQKEKTRTKKKNNK